MGLCKCGGMEGPTPEFTMPMMVLRVKVGADSCPCLSRPRSPAPVLGALLTLVLPTTPTQGCRWLCSPAGEQTPPHVLHMAMLELFCACVPE